MNNPTIWLSIAALVAIGMLLWHQRRLSQQLQQLNSRSDEPTASMLLIQQQLDGLREQLRQSLDTNRSDLDRRLQDVHRGLGEVRVQVDSVQRAAGELKSLQELLRSPKMRGGVGEYLLAELLAQVLPQAHFDLQYGFRGGERVDAILKLGDGLVSVDAKFPLENFKRLRAAVDADDAAAEKAARRQFRVDVRKHIDAIGSRYIRPTEGTYEFAMMYIPAEGVYQEVLAEDELFHYALARKVVPVSPQSFFAYLQVIVMGLRGMSIETRAKEIMAQMGDVTIKLERFGQAFDLVGKHLGNAQRQFDEASRRLEQTSRSVQELDQDAAASSESAPRRSETLTH